MLTLAQRIQIARNTSDPFSSQVAGALVKHAKWVLRAPSQQDATEELARNVLNNPDGYVWRFGAALLTEPAYDAITTVTTITDQQVQDTVSELWGLFVAPESQE